MWVKSIELKGIQSYEYTKVIFSKGVNIIIGENNSGKSTIIKGLYKLQGANTITHENIRKGCVQGLIKILLSDSNIFHFSQPAPHDNSIPALPNEEDHLIVFALSDRFENAVYLLSDYNSLLHDGKFETIMGEKSNGKREEAKKFNYFSADEPDNFIYPFLSRRKTTHYDERTDQKTSNNVSSDLRSLASKIQVLSNASHPEHKNYIEACNNILGFHIGLIPGANGSKVGCIVSSGEYIPLETMGDGVSNILGLIVILLTDKGKLFLIEELENDIHPKALKQLLKLIEKKSQDNQFVISTHSNIVAQYLGTIKDSKLFKTECSFINNTPTSTIKEVESTQEARRNVLEELGYELYDYNLWSGYLILEESSAEVIIKEFLIPHFAPKLIGKIRTVSANGISKVESTFEDFQRIFLFTHLEPTYKNKAWVIVDGDQDGKKIIDQLKVKYSGWNSKNFKTFSKEDFEEYFPSKYKTKVASILAISGENKKQLKRQKKKVLLDEVKVWLRKEPIKAKKAFETSAKEVIAFLKEIETRL